jgi:hypothetical protein
VYAPEHPIRSRVVSRSNPERGVRVLPGEPDRLLARSERVGVDHRVRDGVDHSDQAEIGRLVAGVAVEALDRHEHAPVDAHHARHLGDAVGVGESAERDHAEPGAGGGIHDQEIGELVARDVRLGRRNEADVLRVRSVPGRELAHGRVVQRRVDDLDVVLPEAVHDVEQPAVPAHHRVGVDGRHVLGDGARVEVRDRELAGGKVGGENEGAGLSAPRRGRGTNEPKHCDPSLHGRSL